jgi:hypothetical protein
VSALPSLPPVAPRQGPPGAGNAAKRYEDFLSGVVAGGQVSPKELETLAQKRALDKITGNN